MTVVHDVDVVVLIDGDASGVIEARPLAQELTHGGEDLDPMVACVQDVDVVL